MSPASRFALLPMNRPSYEPTKADLAPHCAEIGDGLADLLRLLAVAPTAARVKQAIAQVRGAQAFLERMKDAIARDGAGDERR